MELPPPDSNEGALDAGVADSGVTQSALDVRPEDANADSLVVFPYERFLAAAKGKLPLTDYADEVAAHVEAQLPRSERRANVG